MVPSSLFVKNPLVASLVIEKIIPVKSVSESE